jgi:menaquinone-dependent protoporphyrinogen oxidase
LLRAQQVRREVAISRCGGDRREALSGHEWGLAASLQRPASMKILVAHGSKRQGTAEIASRIGERLREAGFAVDVIAARDARDVRSYDAVVIGGALHALHWHADARRFVLRSAAALRERQVWFFSSGPLDDSASLREIPPVLQVEELMGHVGARGHATFGGRLAPDAKGFIASRMASTGAGDWRAPDRIDTWARAIADVLRADPRPARLAPKPLPSRAPAVALCLAAGFSAVFGGAVFIARPDGSILEMPLSLLDHSPFHDFLVPGLLLFAVIGVGNTWAAWLHFRRSDYAGLGSLLGGGALVVWIVVQMILLRSFHVLQVAYLVLGLAIVSESIRQIRRLFPPSAVGPPQHSGPAASSA